MSWLESSFHWSEITSRNRYGTPAGALQASDDTSIRRIARISSPRADLPLVHPVEKRPVHGEHHGDGEQWTESAQLLRHRFGEDAGNPPGRDNRGPQIGRQRVRAAHHQSV